MTNRELAELIVRVHDEGNEDGIRLLAEVVRLRGVIYDLKEARREGQLADVRAAGILALELRD